MPHDKKQQVLKSLLLSNYFILALTLVYFCVLVPIIPWIAGPRNLSNILSNLWPLFMVAIGQSFVLIVAGIDLSQTSIMALCSVLGAVLITQGVDPQLFAKSPLWGTLLTTQGGILADSGGVGVALAILVMTMVGVVLGTLNGLAVAHLKMPPFMVTFIGFLLWDKVALYLVKSENIMHLPAAFVALSKGSVLGIPVAMIGTLLVAGGATVLLGKTVFGRWLYATGTNLRAAIVSGVPTQRVIVGAYAISGFCAALGAVLYTGRLECGRPTLGSTLLLDVVGATIIGGISLFGGKGKIQWTFIGALFFVVLANSLSMLNLDSFTIDMVKGGVILGAALLDVVRTNMSGARTA